MSAKQIHAAAIFKDHMVLQRDKDIYIWGTGQNGLAVCAELAGSKELHTNQKRHVETRTAANGSGRAV